MDVHFQQNFDNFAPESQRGSTSLSQTQKTKKHGQTALQHNVPTQRWLERDGPVGPATENWDSTLRDTSDSFKRTSSMRNEK